MITRSLLLKFPKSGGFAGYNRMPPPPTTLFRQLLSQQFTFIATPPTTQPGHAKIELDEARFGENLARLRIGGDTATCPAMI
jgi:hypothetical protein